MEMTDGISPQKDIIPYAGGYELGYLISNLKDCAEWLFSVNQVTEEEQKNLNSMLDSSDKENIYLAQVIIETRKNQYNETTI